MNKVLMLMVVTSTIFYGFCYSREEKEYINKQEESFVPLQKEELKVGGETLEAVARQEVVVAHNAASDIQVSTVSYEAGSRDKWHAHPGGQIIMVTEGEGYYQEKGSPGKLLRKGEVVRCLPGLVHWHGAAPNSRFTFTSIEKQVPGRTIDWFDPVREEEYKGLTSKGVAE